MEALSEIETKGEWAVEKAKILSQCQHKVQVASVITSQTWMQTQELC